MNDANPQLQLAEEFVRHTNCHIFLTGKAGTGKTTFLQTIQKNCHKQLAVTAPTGVAAINAGGVTLHSFFQLPLGPFVPGNEAQLNQHRMRKEKKNIIRGLDLLVIDEVSMVRADLLDGVDSVLRRVRRSDQPFGGVQLLMIGDLYQLPPVVKSDEWQILEKYYASPFFFSSAALGQTEWIPIELKHIYRQSDPRFIDLLNGVRNNTLDAAALAELNARHIPGFSPGDGQGFITLSTHNRGADAINDARLRNLAGKSRRFDAEVEGDFPEHVYPTAASLELKPGAQVMFIRNDMSAEKRYFNGKIGTVTGMTEDAVKVRCPGETGTIRVDQATWENMDYTIDPETAEISKKVTGTFRQYPLKLAWAITIHKSQGLTFDHAIIDAEAAFAHGQVYVALSRCRTLEGIVLSTPLTAMAVKPDPAIQQFGARTADHLASSRKLASAKCRYQQHLLLACFTFERLGWLLGRIAGLLRDHAKVVQVMGGGDIIEVRQRVTAEICDVGEKFKRQLVNMFSDAVQPAADPAILERLARAVVYFEDKFKALLTPCLAAFRVETDNREIRKKINDTAKQLREESAVKLAGVRAFRDGFAPERYLRALSAAAMETQQAEQAGSRRQALTYTEADVAHPELFETLRQWRRQKAAEEAVAQYQVLHQKTLVQIAVHLPVSMKALKRIKGIGPRLGQRYGRELVEMVADYRRRHTITEVFLPQPSALPPSGEDQPAPAAKEGTRQVSLQLFKQGKTIAQIAAQRGLATSTIESHIAYFVSRGQLAIDQVLPDEKRLMMEQALAKRRHEPLKALKASLGDACSYGEIKLVLAHLEHGDHSDRK
jgi:hypothetical protein